MNGPDQIKRPSELISGDFTTAEEPFELFAAWFAEATRLEPNDPNAMALATVDQDGLPDVRMVLLKGYDTEGLYFTAMSRAPKAASLPPIQRPRSCFTGNRCAVRSESVAR